VEEPFQYSHEWGQHLWKTPLPSHASHFSFCLTFIPWPRSMTREVVPVPRHAEQLVALSLPLPSHRSQMRFRLIPIRRVWPLYRSSNETFSVTSESLVLLVSWVCAPLGLSVKSVEWSLNPYLIPSSPNQSYSQRFWGFVSTSFACVISAKKLTSPPWSGWYLIAYLLKVFYINSHESVLETPKI